ncbi:MAG: LysR family transcriptional regulator [Pseudobdellovibrionaceae bacterium]
MNLNNVDFNKLAVFSQVVESGSYRLAAEVLNVTPSALSQSITTLEHSLGLALFHRIGKKLVLTEQGQQIASAFRQQHQGFTEALRRITQKEDQLSGMIHIGAYLEFAKFRLAPLVTEFQKQHPQVQIKWVFDTPSRLHSLLDSGKLDLCFSIYPVRESPLILSQPIYKEELLLLAPAGMLGEKPKYEEVMSHPMIEYYFNHQPIRRWLSLHYKKKHKHLPICTYAATAEMVLTLIQEGLGIGMVPSYALQNTLLANKKIHICRPTAKQCVDYIWMLQLKNRPALSALQVLIEQIQTKWQV